MKDKNGKLTIPGFYKDVRPLTARERKEFKRLPFSEKKYAKELGAPALWGEKGYTALERIWARPTFEVNGLLGGFTGEGAKTVIPAVAMAKVSMRLVPNQDPDKVAKLFERHLKKICPKAVELTITRMHGGQPWVAPIDHPAIHAASLEWLNRLLEGRVVHRLGDGEVGEADHRVRPDFLLDGGEEDGAEALPLLPGPGGRGRLFALQNVLPAPHELGLRVDERPVVIAWRQANPLVEAQLRHRPLLARGVGAGLLRPEMCARVLQLEGHENPVAVVDEPAVG